MPSRRRHAEKVAIGGRFAERSAERDSELLADGGSLPSRERQTEDGHGFKETRVCGLAAYRNEKRLQRDDSGPWKNRDDHAAASDLLGATGKGKAGAVFDLPDGPAEQLTGGATLKRSSRSAFGRPRADLHGVSTVIQKPPSFDARPDRRGARGGRERA